MTRPIYINGRILLREQGGVRRYAQEVSAQLTDATVVRPRSARRAWSARIWEQTTLPRAASDGVLLNMAHSAPVRHQRQVNVVHDLLALDNPGRVNAAYAAVLRWQLPRVITTATKLVTVSTHVADEIAAKFPVARDDIHVVPPGISDAFRTGHKSTARQRLELDLDRPVVAALLDPVPRKNSGQVARLLQELQHERPNIQVVVAGRTIAPAFAHQADPTPTTTERGSANWLDLGPAADIELATMYRAADVFISLTDGEGFGLPMVEAAMCGAAVVTTPVPSIGEYAPRAATTIHTPKEAKTAVTGLLNDPQQRQEQAANAQEALGDLQWGATAASLEVLLNEVAST